MAAHRECGIGLDGDVQVQVTGLAAVDVAAAETADFLEGTGIKQQVETFACGQLAFDVQPETVTAAQFQKALLNDRIQFLHHQHILVFVHGQSGKKICFAEDQTTG